MDYSRTLPASHAPGPFLQPAIYPVGAVVDVVFPEPGNVLDSFCPLSKVCNTFFRPYTCWLARFGLEKDLIQAKTIIPVPDV